ncbi:MAG: hypothetical protein R2711_09220 [Acidimicrobiales bacterium]
MLALTVAAGWIGRVNDPPHEADHATTEHSVEGEGHATEGEGTATEGEGEHGAAAEGPTFAKAPATKVAADEGEEAGAEEEHHVTPPVQRNISWFQTDGHEIKVGTLIDGLSTLMLVVVTFISLLVHVFSTDYVAGDRRYTHYFAFLSLFTASMLFFVIADNTLQMIVGWELVGLCSFGLIGHWWEEKPNSMPP